ncbi:MAG: stage II sporulation protein R [Limnochordales bacterium]|nr:stage II sporulation protein R [Limnochordales bacterium]
MKFTKETEAGGSAWFLRLISFLAGLLIVLGLPLTVRAGTAERAERSWPAAETQEAVLAYNPHNLLRLHILANSDDPSDQQLKLRVRDQLLEITAGLFGSVRSATEAEWLVRLHKAELEAAALREIRLAGKSYGVRLEIGDVYFPDRRYGSLVYPAGIYRAVQVVLGEGRGANWWCVLFPPLCLDSGTGTAKSAGGKTAAAAPPTGLGVARAAATSGARGNSGAMDRDAGRAVRVKIGWKWLPDDWWSQVRGWFR